MHAAISTLNFLGSVPNELEAIFRRGGEWEAGLELAAGLALQVCGPPLVATRVVQSVQGWLLILSTPCYAATRYVGARSMPCVRVWWGAC